jgi:hypothetical protein
MHTTVDADDVVATNIGVEGICHPLRFIQDTDAEIDTVIDPGILQIFPGVSGPDSELAEDDLRVPLILEAHLLPCLAGLFHRHLLVEVSEVFPQLFGDAVFRLSTAVNLGWLPGTNGPGEGLVRHLAAEGQILFEVYR